MYKAKCIQFIYYACHIRTVMYCTNFAVLPSCPGVWLYLSGLDYLSPPLLQLCAGVLTQLRNMDANSPFVTIDGTSFRASKPDSSFCLASVSMKSAPRLSPVVLQVFKTCTVQPHDKLLVAKAVLLASGFQFIHNLAPALEHFLSSLIPGTVFYPTISAICSLAAEHLKVVQAESRGYTAHFPLLGIPVSSYIRQLASHVPTYPPRGHGLPNGREQSQSLGSLSLMEEEEKEVSESMVIQQVEELCVVLAITELMEGGAQEVDRGEGMLVEQLRECFSCVDAASVAMGWAGVRAELSERSILSLEVVESMHESRAASVMFSDSDRDARATSEGTMLVHCVACIHVGYTTCIGTLIYTGACMHYC